MASLSLADIEKLCREYDTSCTALGGAMAELDVDLQKVKVKHLATLKRLAGVVARDEAELQVAVEGAPELFVKPRTAIFHGTKVGFTKSPGKVETDDEKRSIELIRGLFPKRLAELVNTTEKLNKDAVKKLDEDERAKIGCRVEDAGDLVVIKRVDGEIEKLVDKFIEKMVNLTIESGTAAKE